jgi:hypothetical protein
MLRMSVPGERSEADKAREPVSGSGAEVLARLGIGVTVEDAVRVAGRRAAADRVVLEAAAPDDPVEVTLEGGVRLYLPAQEAAELLAATDHLARSSRGRCHSPRASSSVTAPGASPSGRSRACG